MPHVIASTVLARTGEAVPAAGMSVASTFPLSYPAAYPLPLPELLACVAKRLLQPLQPAPALQRASRRLDLDLLELLAGTAGKRGGGRLARGWAARLCWLRSLPLFFRRAGSVLGGCVRWFRRESQPERGLRSDGFRPSVPGFWCFWSVAISRPGHKRILNEAVAFTTGAHRSLHCLIGLCLDSSKSS